MSIESYIFETLNPIRYRGIPKALSLKTDVKNFQDKFVVVCEVPGLKREAISVQLEADILTIEVNLPMENSEENATYLLRERMSGKVTRKFRLPDVDTTNITAALEDGILTLTLPKLAEKAKRTIEIQ